MTMAETSRKFSSVNIRARPKIMALKNTDKKAAGKALPRALGSHFYAERAESQVANHGRQGHYDRVDAQGGNAAELKQHRLQHKRHQDDRKAAHPSSKPTSPLRIRWALEGPMGT